MRKGESSRSLINNPSEESANAASSWKLEIYPLVGTEVLFYAIFILSHTLSLCFVFTGFSLEKLHLSSY